MGHGFITLLLAAALFVLPAPRVLAFSYYAQTFPSGTVGLAKPDIGMAISDPDENVQPTSYSLYLNGKEVPVTYNASTLTFRYTPDQPLSPGNYEARLVIEYDGYKPLSNTWSFTVAGNALASLPAAFTSGQLSGIAAVNDYRLIYGLPQLTVNASLMAAAEKHAQYLSDNNIDPSAVSMHDENASLPGYIGATLGDRARFVGYTGGVAEDVSYHSGSLVESIDSLFDAPYHRIPFLDPAVKEIGIAQEGDFVDIEFGVEPLKTPELLVTPAPGDAYVPTAFDGHEDPDPLRLHTSASYPVGYPLMASVSGSNVKTVTLQTAKLTDASGNDVKLLINDPGSDDHLDNEIILMPEKPLAYDATYNASVTVTAQMTDGSSRQFEKTWSFHTEPSDGFGKKKLHAYAADYKRAMTAGTSVRHTVSFGLDSGSYVLDNVTFPLQMKPYIENGSSYLWIRDLAAALGAKVEWDDANKAAIYTKGDRTVKFYTMKPVYSVNGVEHTTDVPAKLRNNLTIIPVRLLSETLGAQVGYVDSSRTVNITY
jgi:uncharacterized protein YkwD